MSSLLANMTFKRTISIYLALIKHEILYIMNLITQKEEIIMKMMKTCQKRNKEEIQCYFIITFHINHMHIQSDLSFNGLDLC